MSSDILKLFIDGVITKDELYDLFEAAVEDSHQSGGDQVHVRVGLSARELQALLHGVGLAEVAAWRRDGWPPTCDLCGSIIDYDREHWHANHRKVNRRHVVSHSECANAVFRAIRASLARDFTEEESLQIVGPSHEYPRGYWVRYDAENRPMDPATDKAIEDPTDPHQQERTRIPLPPWQRDS